MSGCYDNPRPGGRGWPTCHRGGTTVVAHMSLYHGGMLGCYEYSRPGGRGWRTCHRGGTTVVWLVVMIIHALVGVVGLHAVVKDLGGMPVWQVVIHCALMGVVGIQATVAELTMGWKHGGMLGCFEERLIRYDWTVLRWNFSL